MNGSGTTRHILLAVLVAGGVAALGCSSSHGPAASDGSTDGSTDAPPTRDGDPPPPPPPPPDCFAAGTPIDTPKGRVPIERLETGDDVYAFDERNERLAVAKVVRTYRRDDRVVREVTLQDGRALHVSATHPFYDADAERYVEVADLKPGTALLDRDPKHGLRTMTVRSVDQVPERTTIYNVEVSTHHNYFAGGVLVHNKSPAVCRGGPCCEDSLGPTAGGCPDGYSYDCTPDPARCASCDAHADCELALNRCCGPCGEPALDDYHAIHGDHREEHRDAVCPEPEPCPECAMQHNPALGATCTAGRCRGFDVRAMELSACDTHDDCRLRVTDCCECGGDTSPPSLIAIRGDAAADAEYQSLVCDDTGCPECEPTYPTEEVEAYCADDGHCDVRAIDSGG